MVTNIVAILLIYHSFEKNLDKSKKLLYTMISMGVMYIAILIIYFFSSIGIDKDVAKESKQMITFTFVPVNSIILVPFLIWSFNKKKHKEITTEQLNRRTIIMGVIAIILVIVEFFYFRNIEKGIINVKNQKEALNNTEITNVQADEENNSEEKNAIEQNEVEENITGLNIMLTNKNSNNVNLYNSEIINSLD